ncbi:phage integrase SAM-like domain-containing protein [Flagellimonas sp. SN16]|uniref:phage integrase SAM-like domain-containing protein n=1 Tax=Flagellimonas sp. SN16 TaxID=3415142 RepID=UPI003C699553
MATIKYSLSGKPENSSIRISLSAGRGTTLKAPTGFYTRKEFWSFTKKNGKEINNGQFKHSILAPERKIKNDLIKLEKYILDAFNDTQSNGSKVNNDWLKHQIDRCFDRVSASGQSEFVIDSIESIIKDAEVRKNQKGGIGLSKSRINDYKALKRIWMEFEGNIQIKVKEVNVPLSKKFLSFMLKDKKYGKGYAQRMMGNLKTVCYDAQLADIKTSPQLKKIDASQLKNDHIIFLAPDELDKIKKANLLHDGQRNARKWLLLGCWIGQRGNDLLNLTENNIKEKEGFRYIELVQQKTGKKVAIPILPEVEEIIESGWPRKISLVKFNDHIKTIAEKAKLHQPTEGILNDPETNRKKLGSYPKWQLLASHVCRRSYCSNMYGKMPTPIIMQVTGHATEKSFLNYIGKKGTDYKDEWMRFIELEKQKAKKVSNLEIVPKASNE